MPKERGYLNQLESPRETLANTAACFAVERTKFDAIGGFDADNLPVDLNDIDLCLRVAERGWTNIWTPDAIMFHAQSASRGNEKDPFHIYRQERAYFMQRWAETIRDDPYFHPGLSLFSQQPALG
jgi:GT2 family glycosyltransferase